ncbi:hypothetical protein DFAR_1390005 [Desulfarculales bacterium]
MPNHKAVSHGQIARFPTGRQGNCCTTTVRKVPYTLVAAASDGRRAEFRTINIIYRISQDSSNLEHAESTVLSWLML